MKNRINTSLFLTPTLGPLAAAGLSLLGSLTTGCGDHADAKHEHEEAHNVPENGTDGIDGTAGEDGAPGAEGSKGVDGQDGADGSDAASPYIDLPGESFYPEGIAVDEEGKLYVGSFVTGAVLIVDQDTKELTELPVSTLQNIAGLATINGTLYACTNSMTTGFDTPPAVAEINIETGAEVARHEFAAGPGVCNDLTFDDEGNLYATESFSNSVYTVKADDLGADSIAAVFSDDALFSANYDAGNFGLNGIVFDGESALYMVSHYTGELFKLPIEMDGSAAAPELVALQDPMGAPRDLMMPDGLKLIGEDTLMVAEQGQNAISRISLTTGTVSPTAGGLDNPATFVLDADGDAWVVNSQLNDFAGGTAPTLPFNIVEVDLD